MAPAPWLRQPLSEQYLWPFVSLSHSRWLGGCPLGLCLPLSLPQTQRSGRWGRAPGREGKVGIGFSLPPVWDLSLPRLHLSPLLAAPFRFQFPSLPESTSLSDPRASGSKLLAKTMIIFPWEIKYWMERELALPGEKTEPKALSLWQLWPEGLLVLTTTKPRQSACLTTPSLLATPSLLTTPHA